jgi:hypothetical protein
LRLREVPNKNAITFQIALLKLNEGGTGRGGRFGRGKFWWCFGRRAGSKFKIFVSSPSPRGVVECNR